MHGNSGRALLLNQCVRAPHRTTRSLLLERSSQQPTSRTAPVRVIGNEAVHPGQINLRDDRQTAETLFQLVNLVVQRMISEPKAVQAIYDGLPETARDKIAKRDQPRPIS
jgi:hypothetical protein